MSIAEVFSNKFSLKPLLASLSLSLFCSLHFEQVSSASFQLQQSEQLESIKGQPSDHLFHLLPKEDIDDVRRFHELETMEIGEIVTEPVYKFAPGFEGLRLVRLKPIDTIKFKRRDNNFYWRVKYDWGWVALTLGPIATIIFISLYSWNYRLLKPAPIPLEPTDQRSWLQKML